MSRAIFIRQIEKDIENLEKAVDKIGNYSGCYPQKVEIFDYISVLRNDLALPRKEVRRMTKEDIENELGYKIEIID